MSQLAERYLNNADLLRVAITGEPRQRLEEKLRCGLGEQMKVFAPNKPSADEPKV
ncbi:hypothetical protein [Roseibium algae]|uniref:Uncharacterized protein n=1 Tax=Roseibium algae TaxID=3123038 RepID=A0ABU8TE59_9HYPH